MAEDKRIIYLEINASKAVEGSAAATRALEKLERSTASMDGALSRMEAGLGRVGGYLKAQIALIAAELGARLVQMGKDAFNAAAGLGELAEQLGVSARFLQAMQVSAVQSGVKLEQLETGISKFSQKMGEAADGSKEMVEALDKLGVKNLDAAGKLRSTESLMVDVAIAITSIEDPARRASTAVDFFGKAGTRMLPMLADIAKGADNVTAATERMGAMISDSTIARLDKFGDRLAVGARVHLATFAEAIVSVIDQLDKFDAWMQGGANGINKWLRGATSTMGDWVDSTLGFLDAVVIAGARFNAGFAEAIRSIPEALGRVFVDGMNAALIALETGLNKITNTLADKAPWLGIKGGSISLGRIDGGGASASGRNAGIAAAEDAAEAQLRANGFGRDYAAERARQRFIDKQAGFAADEDAARIGKLGPLDGGGRGLSKIKGAGQGEADKYAKLIAELTLAADAQDKMTAAARSGDVAFQDQEIKLKAAEKALGIYGQALAATDPRLQKIEELISRDTMGKAAQSYVTATTEIERQNEVLEAEIRLINATIPARAAEIALIKAKQDADKAGQALTPQDKEGRRVAIEQNERLKAQGEELRKANELWTAPLKSALESIQRVGADAFEQMLTNGNFTFQSLGDTFKKIVIRMAAEFMALATIRPVMSVLVNAVSPGMASTMGLGGGGGGGMPGVPSFGGGMSGFELPSFLGGGTIGELMAATPFASAAPAGGFADIGALMASGQAGSSAGLAAGGIQGAAQGLSVGSMMGGAMGIGMGAYSLATANGSTGKTIGGIGQMIGGGMMLIPGMQIPGMIVSALSTIITLALGMFTPTSITVVATIILVFPSENRCISKSFSAAFIFP